MGRAEDLFERLQAGGERAVDELIDTRQSEELFLDFKRSSDNGSGMRLSDTDRKNLSKAISGFGNSEGGVIIWGVDCSPDSTGADLPRFKVPLADSHRFVSWLEAAVSGATVPAHPLVRSAPIGAGFAVTLIPKSDLAPHQTVPSQQYFIRAGSNFTPTPHAVLAGMFGRRPLPRVFHHFTNSPAKVRGVEVECNLGIWIRNQGPGLASDLYLTLVFSEAAQGGSRIAFKLPDPEAWIGRQTFGIHTSFVTKEGFRLPPEAQLIVLHLSVTLLPPFDSGINATGMVGAGNSPPYRFDFRASREQLQQDYERIVAASKAGVLTESDLREFLPKLLGQKSEAESEDIA